MSVPQPPQGGKKAPPPPSEDDMEEEEEEAELQYDDDDDDVDNEDAQEEEIVEEESSSAANTNAPITSNNSLKISLKRAPSPKHTHQPPPHQAASSSGDSLLLTRTQTDPTAPNEWDDETSAMEAAKQSERDKRHQPNMESRMNDDEDEDMPDDEDGEDLGEGGIVVIEAQAPPEDEDMSSSDSDSDSDSSDSSSSDEDPVHISSSSARPPSALAPAPIPPSSSKSEVASQQQQQQQRRSQTVTPPTVSSLASSPFEMLSHSAAALNGNGGESSSSLLDAMSNPPPPSMSNLRHASSTSSSSSSANHAHSDDAKKPKFSPTANVIKLSLKKTKAADQQIKEEDEEGMEDEEDEPKVKQESAGEQIRVKLEAATIPNATITASSSNNKLKLTIPRKPSASAPPPNITAFHAPSSHATSELKDEGVPQVKLEPISLPLTHSNIVTGSIANPNPISDVAASASPSDSAASPSPSSPESSVASQIPPRTATTNSGRAALAQYRSYFFSEKPEWSFPEPDKFLRIEGTEINQGWVKRTGMRTPFIASNASTLGMKIPRAADVSYRSVVSQLPPDMDLIVIDVATQTESMKWKLDDWVKYMETPQKDRTAVCNIISLEVSQTSYAKANVQAPTFARENDWNGRLWPEQVVLQEKPLYENIDMLVAGKKHTAKKIKNEASSASASDSHTSHYIQTIPAPVPVQLYLLMGAAGSYTDFHVDFGGSSVWYHVVKGEKIFLLAEPTPENLKVYEEWNNGGKQAKTFLADLYHKRDMEAAAVAAVEGGVATSSKKLTATSPPLTVKRISVKAGETLFLPSGWIHSVFTPVDSLVFGANFLHGFHVSSQLCIYNIELNSHIPLRWKFPEFEALHWLWMKENIFRLRKPLAQLHISMWELQGLANCVKTAAWWMASSAAARLRGFDLSRRRFGSRFELPEVQDKILKEEAKAQELEEAIVAAEEVIAQGQKYEARHLLEEAKQHHTYKYVSLNWEHNIPFEWNEALALLRELDALVSYNIYLIEREEYDDQVENGTHQAKGENDDEVKDDTYWSHREQQATNCFQAAQTLKHHTYDLTEMIEPSSLSWLRKSKKGPTRRMTAKESAEVISAALKTNNRRRNVENREPDELDKEMAELEHRTEQIKSTPLAPTASGRVRHHSSMLDDSVLDDAADEEADDEEKEAQVQEGFDSQANAGDAASRSKRAAKRKRVDDDSEEDDDEEYHESDDSDEEYAESEDDEFEVDSKRNKKHSQGGRGNKKAKHDEKDSSHAVPSAGAPLNIKELQARARLAASAASSNASAKKKIGAPAPTPTAPRAQSGLSTKDRILAKMASRRR